MENSLITYFNQHLVLSEEEIEYVTQHVPLMELEPNEVLLKEGEVSTAFYFVVEGCIRMYYVVEGVEKTTCFYHANDFVSSYESFTKQVPSRHYFASIKRAKVAVFSAPVVNELLQRFPRFDILARIAMEEELSIAQDMIASFITLNAKQRYLKLLKSKPNLLQDNIPQYHIATYLGVSPETLSRIRNRISSKGIY